MQITINLCSTPYIDVEPLVRKLRIAMASLGVLSLTAGALLGLSLHKKVAYVSEERQVDASISRHTEELGRFRKLLERPENISIANRALALNSIFEEKSFSWTTLMKDFEGLVPPDVQLATIQPVREKDGTISLRVHVVGPRAKVVELIHGLEQSRSFLLPHVMNESARSDPHPGQHAQPLTDGSVEEFDVLTGYDADAAAEPQAPATDTAGRETAANPVPCPACAKPASTKTSNSTASVLPAMAVRAGGMQ